MDIYLLKKLIFCAFSFVVVMFDTILMGHRCKALNISINSVG